MKKLGFYCTVLSLDERTGLYYALIASFEVVNANRRENRPILKALDG
jgi:hypothetical protein